MNSYEVIESWCWKHVSGRTASIYGACPWVTKNEASEWTRVMRGYTVRNLRDGTVGVGRKPWPTREEAEKFVAQFA